MIRDAATHQEAVYAYIAPFFVQAKRVAWDYLKKYSEPIPGMNFNESELVATFPSGSKIYLLGAEKQLRLKGLGLDGVVFDEYSQQPASIFTEVISPALMDKKGYATWIGTPRGKNEFWRLYENGQSHPDWYTLMLKASESGILPQEELDRAKEQMSKEEYEQEMECSPVAYIKGAIWGDELAELRREGRLTRVPHDSSIPVETAWDLGMNDTTVIWFFQRIAGSIRIIDMYAANKVGIPHYCKVVREKPYNHVRAHLPHDVAVRELGTGQSRLEVFQSLLGACQVMVVPQLPLIDGLEATRRKIAQMYFDVEKCSTGFDALEQYQREWDDAKGMFRNTPRHDWTSHYADALRYLALSQEAYEDIDDVPIEPEQY